MNVNTDILNSQANNANLALLPNETIRQQGFDIEGFALDAQILLGQIHEQLDALVDLTPASISAVAAVNCFVTCTLRNVELIARANINILTAVAGGAA